MRPSIPKARRRFRPLALAVGLGISSAAVFFPAFRSPAPQSASGPSLDLSGGQGTGTGGHGGTFILRAVEGLAMGSADLPPAPSPGAVLTDLSSDVVSSGDVTISGDITTSGADPVRSITANNITISGTLRAFQGIAGVQGLALHASGTLFVSGTIDGSGTAGGAGGAISLTAQAAFVLGPSGKIAANGGIGQPGGTIAIEQSAQMTILGAVQARGGDGSGAGPGGNVSIGVRLGAGQVQLGWTSLLARGGDGGSAGGGGGTIDASSFRGGAQIAGTWDVSGGDAPAKGGAGGTIRAQSDIGGGDLTVGAILMARGGAGTGSPGAGGDAGLLHLLALFDKSRSSGTGGSVYYDGAADAELDGGAASGSGDAGKGGTMIVEIPESRVVIMGRVQARGGAASGSGHGGLGGFFWIASDLNLNSTGGDVLIEPGALIDVSGGSSAGGTGGDAQWSSQAGDFQPLVIPISVLIDSDGHNGRPNQGGWIENDGVIIAQGGAPGGHGGDIEFHGYGLDVHWEGPGEPDPSPGDVRQSGNGAAASGVFSSD